MTRAEALKVLDLPEDTTPEQVRDAHRRLMLANHPDRGGSTYIAAQINRAKDVLLGEG
jgi:DnaJ-class molecular chaperone